MTTRTIVARTARRIMLGIARTASRIALTRKMARTVRIISKVALRTIVRIATEIDLTNHIVLLLFLERYAMRNALKIAHGRVCDFTCF